MRSPLPALPRHLWPIKARSSRILGARLYLLRESLVVLPVGQKVVPRFGNASRLPHCASKDIDWQWREVVVFGHFAASASSIPPLPSSSFN